MNSDFLSFHLSDDFVDQYKNVRPDWKFDIGGGNSLSELIFVTKYSRLKDDGTKEQWYEVCRRCVEGMYSILKDHAKSQRTPWNDFKAQKSAQDAFDRMFKFKWTPPGRGLQHMGTEGVHVKGVSDRLQNCAMLSTAKLSSHSYWEAVGPFCRMMEMSMCGIGCGFDTRGAGNITLHEPTSEKELFTVPDTREGWADSVGALLASYFFKNRKTVEFDYSDVRPAGAELKSFGGRASGPGPLIDAHESITKQLSGRTDEHLSSRDIVDIMNKIGKAVVAGGSRRSAQIAFGDPDDQDYIGLKDWNLVENAARTGQDGWAWTSNNSVFVGKDGISEAIVDKIKVNGEPGLMWLELAQQYGRMIDTPDNRDYRVVGGNPCLEQSLEDAECCTLVEMFPTRNESFEDFRETIKRAYLYGKAVTLLPTSWPETNEVMARNRRIGCSMTGLAEFVETRSWSELRRWMDEGYQVLQYRDRIYSEWLAVRESIKTTSIKPSGTVSILASVTPGVHWPKASGRYIRTVRFSVGDPLVDQLIAAGYGVEPSNDDPNYTVVATFVTQGQNVRNELEVSLWEKAELAALAQRYWADNQVSATLTFQEHEIDQIGPLLASKDGQFKGVSFLQIGENEVYEQAPYQKVGEALADYLQGKAKPLGDLYAAGLEAIGDKFCDSDVCEVKF